MYVFVSVCKMVLSGSGISFAEEKVNAVTSAREPQNVLGTCSFLRQVNYCWQFIFVLAMISEPLSEKSGDTTQTAEGGIQTVEEVPVQYRDFRVF